MIIFFFNDTATTEIYTLSLHDALPISGDVRLHGNGGEMDRVPGRVVRHRGSVRGWHPARRDRHLRLPGPGAGGDAHDPWPRAGGPHPGHRGDGPGPS